jgi:hypothetical protein
VHSRDSAISRVLFTGIGSVRKYGIQTEGE